jgi:hypothetical protein
MSNSDIERNTRHDGQGKTHRSCQKHETLSLRDILSIGCHLSGVSFITSLRSNLCTALTTQSTTEKNYYLTRTKHDCTSVLHISNWNTSVTGHKKGRIVFPQRKQLSRSTANSCQLSVPYAVRPIMPAVWRKLQRQY